MPPRHVVRALEVQRTLSPKSARAGRPTSRGGSVADGLRATQDERHSYEKCQYVEFKKRVAKMDELRESKGGARSN